MSCDCPVCGHEEVLPEPPAPGPIIDMLVRAFGVARRYCERPSDQSLMEWGRSLGDEAPVGDATCPYCHSGQVTRDYPRTIYVDLVIRCARFGRDYVTLSPTLGPGASVVRLLVDGNRALRAVTPRGTQPYVDPSIGPTPSWS